MKTKLLILISVCAMTFISMKAQQNDPLETNGDKVAYFIADQGLEALVENMVMSINSQNPELHVKFLKENELSELDDSFKIVNADYITTHPQTSGLYFLIGRDVIVPVFNPKNPLLEVINKQGVSLESIVKLLSDKQHRDWNVLLGEDQKGTVNVYFSSDSQIMNDLAIALNISSEIQNVKVSPNQNDLLNAIRNDINSIGFCRLTDILVQEENSFVNGISVLPIDHNKNGHLDATEKFYENPEAFSRGVWIGKYPKTLCRGIYAIAPIDFFAKTNNDLLLWLLGEGQTHLIAQGFSGLTYYEKQASIRNISADELNVITEEADYSWISILIILFACMIVFGIIITLFFRDRTVPLDHEPTPNKKSIFNEASISAPKGLFYDKTHTWSIMENDGKVKVGMDNFMQHIIGPIDRVKTMDIGKTISKGDPLVTLLQNGKQVFLRSPISGTIVEKNAHHNPLQNEETNQWIYKIEPLNWKRELQFMLMVDEYKLWLKDEFVRFRDFLANAVHIHTPAYSQITLQDGGELKEGLMADLGPEVWEDLQTQFLDTLN